jgi:hypothetical protein
MSFSPPVRAAAILLSLYPLCASALTCTTPQATAVIERLDSAGHDPVVVSGIPLARRPVRGDLVTDMVPMGPGMVTHTFAYRILGHRTGAGGWTTPALVEATLDVLCETGYCGDLPDRFEARTFILWESDDGLIGYAGICGVSIHPLATPAENMAIRRCLAMRACD